MLIATYAYIRTPHLGTLANAVTAQVGASGNNGAPQVGTLANAGSLLLGTQSLGTALQSLTSLLEVLGTSTNGFTAPLVGTR
jgi:hypothetical protein